MMALEIAMDEMAEKLGLDPIEFRILNDTQVDPEQSGAAVLAAPAGRMPAHRRRALRLEQAQSASRARSATGAGWSAWASPPHSATICVTKSAARVRLDQQRRRHGRDRHDRHRHRQLHDHRPDRRRDDGRAARQGRRAPRRFDVSGLGRLGRAMGRQQLDRRRLCRLRQAARGRGAEARLQFRRRRVRRRPGSLGQPQRAARPGRGATASSSPRTRIEYRRPRTRNTSNRPSARISSRSASMPRPARSACGACSRSAPPAASSIRSPRAAR